MAAHRYWRVYSTGGWGGGGIGVAAIQLRESVEGVDRALLGIGSVIGEGTVNEGYPYTNAFDAEVFTFTLFTQGSPVWLGRDFGAGVAYDITHLTLQCPENTFDTYIQTGLLQWSDDGTEWTTSFPFTTSGYTASQLDAFTYTPPANADVYLHAPLLATQVYDAGNAVWVSVSPPVSPLAAFGGATASLSPPSPILAFHPGGGIYLTAPSPNLSFFAGGVRAELTAPSPTLFATARSSAGENDFTYTGPSPTLSAFGGASIKLDAPSPSLSITATVVNFGSAELEAPTATLYAAGTVSGTGQASLTYGNNVSSFSLIGYGGAVANITLTGSPAVQATGTTGGVGGAQITAPLFELTASGTAQNYGSALLAAPAGRLGATARAWLMAPGATLTAIGSAVVVATYEAYAVNLNHRSTDSMVDEATRYTNFPFTHVVRYKNSYFGANATGLYLLEGTTDDGANINYAIKTATSDFDSPNQKTVASAYFSGRLGPEATVTLYAGEGAGVPYAYNTVRGALAQNHREVFGKGIKDHRYYALGLSGADVLELDNIELDVKQMNRRI